MRARLGPKNPIRAGRAGRTRRRLTGLLGAAAVVSGVAAAALSAAAEISSTLEWPEDLIAALWVAVGVFGVAAILLGVAVREAERRAGRRRELAGLLATSSGGAPRVPRVSDESPYGVVGVSPSKYAGRMPDPPYVRRDVDDEVERTLLEQRFVLLVGESKAGKTRTAFEALRRRWPNAGLLIPGDASKLADLLELDSPLPARDGPAVLWLDELDRFLGGQCGLTLPRLRGLLRREPAILVVCTMRLDRRDELMASDYDARLLLNQVAEVDRAVIVLTPEMSERERSDAERKYPEEDFQRGVGPQMVAASELERRYVQGRATDPTGWAVVQAAIDCQRAGGARPLSRQELRRLFDAYLPAVRRDLDPTEDRFVDGLRWARNPVAPNISLLETLRPDGEEASYRAFEYIAAWADGRGRPVAGKVPDSTWDFVIDRATPVEANRIGFIASNRGERNAARRAWAAAMESGEEIAATSAVNLGLLLAQDGDLAGASAAYQWAIDRGSSEVAAWAAQFLGVARQYQGDQQGALDAYQLAIGLAGLPQAAAMKAVLLAGRDDHAGAQAAYEQALAGGLDKLLVASVKLNMALMLVRRGRADEGRELLEELVRDRDATAALWADPHHAEGGADTAIQLGRRLEQAGDRDGAEAAYRFALGCRDGALALRAAIALTPLLFERDDLEGARTVYAQALDAGARGVTGSGADRERAKGEARRAMASSDPEAAAKAAYELAELLGKEGDVHGTREAYQAAIDSGHPVYAPVSAWLLGVFLREHGDPDGACRALEWAVESGHPEAAPMAARDLAELLRRRGDHEGAYAALRRALGSANIEEASRAGRHLALLLREDGDLQGARRALERVIALSNPRHAPYARYDLGVILEQAGDLGAARESYLRAAESGFDDLVPEATLGVGRTLHRQGRLKAAAGAFAVAASSGHRDAAPEAFWRLGDALGRLGKVQSAREAYEKAIETGHTEFAPRAMAGLGFLLHRSGDLQGAEAQYRSAVSSGHPDVWPKTAVNLGALLLQHGRTDEARVVLRRAAESGDPEAAAGAAQNLELLDRPGDG